MGVFGIGVLSLSGIMLLSVGALRSIDPIGSYAKNSEIELGDDVNLLNEVRGTSALMLLGGAIILLGIAIPRLTLAAFVLAAVIFFGFAIGRSLGVLVDGRPSPRIVRGLVVELVFGSLNVFGLLRHLT